MAGFLDRLFGKKATRPPVFGRDLGWTDIGILLVRSGRVWVGDAQFAVIEKDGEIVRLSPGEHMGQVKRLDYRGPSSPSPFSPGMGEGESRPQVGLVGAGLRGCAG